MTAMPIKAMNRATIIVCINDHAEARGDLRKVGPKSQATKSQLARRLKRIEAEADTWSDMP